MLDGYRILDLTDSRAHLTGRILGDLGADVIKVEPPGGDAARRRGPFAGEKPGDDRALGFLAFNSSKRSVCCDLEDEEGRTFFRELVAKSDVVIESYAPGWLAERGLDYEALVAGLPEGHPGLVHCAITPFGQEGPRADYVAGDLVTVAMGGNAFMTGDPDYPPVRCSAPTSTFHAAPEAALAILMALYARPALGRGQFVDVSMQEVQLSTLITGAGQFALTGRVTTRGGYKIGDTREIWACKDGWISYGLRGGPARAGSLAATVEYMGESGLAPDWLRAMDWATYSPLSLSAEELERLEAAFAAFFATKTMRELYEESLRRRILLAPCNDAREIFEQAQLRDRGLFRKVDFADDDVAFELPAFFAKSSREGAIGIRSRAPRVDEHSTAIRRELSTEPPRAEPAPAPEVRSNPEGGIFAGLKVLELGAGAAGPVATRYFAEQGATVLRIESAKRPDFLRILHLTKDNRNEPRILEKAPMFVLLNPNKQSIAVNMKAQEGIDLVRRLVDWADVVAENFAPGVMERFGLAPERLLADKPDLVMASGCLFGQTGPQRTYPGFGGQGAAIAGFNHLTGWPEGEAVGPYATITDSLAPRYVATTIVAALLEKRRTGRGQAIDVSQIETGVYSLSKEIARFAANGEVVSRRGNHDEEIAPHAIYPCRDVAFEDGSVRESWIAIAIRDDDAWRALGRCLGDPDWASDPDLATNAGRLARQSDLDARIAAATRDREAHGLMDELQAAGVEAGVVQRFDELLADPQLAVREHWVDLDHAVLGRVKLERSGFRFSEIPGGLHSAGPLLGEHTDEILRDVLGLAEDEIERLKAEDVLS